MGTRQAAWPGLPHTEVNNITGPPVPGNTAALRKQQHVQRMYIHVLDIHGKPLMPTQRVGKVRRLLDSSKARVVRRTPFTVQLLYETTDYTQPVTLGLDPGSKVAGLSCTTNKAELLRVEVQLRTDVTGLLATRREARRTRRSRKLRHRQARFDNRRRPEGWLAPSIRQRVDSHLSLVRMACSVLPVSRIVVETAQFDMQRIQNPGIARTDYQHGGQEGWKNVREYVLWRDGHTCRCCSGKSKDPVLEVHHLESRKTGGNSPANLVTLCRTCHDDYHAGKTELRLKRTAPSLRDAAAVNIYRWRIYKELIKEHGKNRVSLIYGYTTKDRRISLALPKTSETDAFCIADNLQARRIEAITRGQFIRRQSRSLHVFLPAKGGLRRSTLAPKEIGNTRLHRYDSVSWKGVACFIAGTSNGRPIIRDIDWKLVSGTATVNAKTLSFTAHKHGALLLQTFRQNIA